MIQIPIAALKKARTLLGRVRLAQCKLPALNHILARVDGSGITPPLPAVGPLRQSLLRFVRIIGSGENDTPVASPSYSLDFAPHAAPTCPQCRG